jgi:hypothetical protein
MRQLGRDYPLGRDQSPTERPCSLAPHTPSSHNRSTPSFPRRHLLPQPTPPAFSNLQH